MKLIAKRSFRNPGRQIKLDKYEVNEDHIHQGAVFEIGTAAKYEGLNRTDQELVAQLNLADCIADATDANIVKQVEKKVAVAAQLSAPTEARNLLKVKRAEATA